MTLIEIKHRSSKRDITPKELEDIGLRARFSHLRLTQKDCSKIIEEHLSVSEQRSLLRNSKQIEEDTKDCLEEIKKQYISPTGGGTICEIFLDDKFLVSGESFCHPSADVYNKHFGCLKAFGNAIRNLKSKPRVDGMVGNHEVYDKILSHFQVGHIRPKLPSKKRRYSASKIKKIIEDIVREVEENNGHVDDIQTSCFIEDFLEQIED